MTLCISIPVLSTKRKEEKKLWAFLQIDQLFRLSSKIQFKLFCYRCFRGEKTSTLIFLNNIYFYISVYICIYFFTYRYTSLQSYNFYILYLD